VIVSVPPNRKLCILKIREMGNGNIMEGMNLFQDTLYAYIELPQ
jgi:hypothetical protein